MLYLVRFDNALKIGYTSNLINRLKSFETTQLNVELVSSREGDLKHEKILHELCSSARLKNELFKDEQIVISIFNNHIFNDEEIKNKNLEMKNKELMIANSALKLEIKQLNKENQKIIDNLKFARSRLDIIEDRIEIMNKQKEKEKEKEIKDFSETTMLINKDTIVKTNYCFNYKKKYPHKGEDRIMIKYSNNIIDIAEGKLFYNIENKEVLTKYFYPAKSYPAGNENIKYYYYDSDCNIKHEDILNIKKLVVDNFIKS